MEEFYKIVKRASSKQRANLSKLTEAGFGDSPRALRDHIKFLRSGAIGQIFYDKSWKQVVTDVADHVHIDWNDAKQGRPWRKIPTADIENAVVKKLFKRMIRKLSPEQQEQIVMQMRGKTDNRELEALLATGGVMAVAKGSGFGVYLMASTVLGGITNAVGITLPFAVYMGMSQAIAFVIGPVGWVALAGGILHSINQPNWEKLTRAVVYVALIRASSDGVELPPSGGWESAIKDNLNENLKQAKIDRANREREEFWKQREASTATEEKQDLSINEEPLTLEDEIAIAIGKFGGDRQKAEIFIKLRSIISYELGVNEKDVNLDTHLSRHLKVEYMDLIELSMTLEEMFGVAISDEDLERVGVGQFDCLSFSPSGGGKDYSRSEDCIVRNFVELIAEKLI